MLLACKKQPIETSETKWGVLGEATPENNYNDFLINIPPHSEIAICGALRNEVMEAFREWSNVLNRTKYLNLSLHKSCESIDSSRFDGVIASFDWEVSQPRIMNERSYKAITEGCKNTDQEGGLAMFQQLSNHVKPWWHIIGTCRMDKVTKHRTVHEMGHAWGLCDQYTIENDMVINHRHHENCNQVLRSLENYQGIMAARPPRVLGTIVESPTEYEDILGIRVLACLESESAMKWATLNKEAMKTWRGVSDEIQRIKSLSTQYSFLEVCTTLPPAGPPEPGSELH